MMETKSSIKTIEGFFDCEEGHFVSYKGKQEHIFPDFICADWKAHPADLMAQLNAFFRDKAIGLELIQLDEGSDQDIFVIKDLDNKPVKKTKESDAVKVRKIVEGEIIVYRHFNDKRKGSRRLKFATPRGLSSRCACGVVDKTIKQKLIAAGIGWIEAGWYETATIRGSYHSYVVRLPL